MTTVAGSIALIVTSMCVGGAGTYAVTHEPDDGMAELLEQRSAVMLEISERAIALHTQALAEARRLFEGGYADDAHVRQLEVQLHQARVEVEIHRLNLEEVRLTGREPNDSLAAPLVGDTDFVTARMKVQLELLERQLFLFVTEVQRLETLVESGRVSSNELHAAHAARNVQMVEIETLQSRLALRQAFIDGEESGEAVELQAMIDQARAGQQSAEHRVYQMQKQVTELRKLAEAGVSGFSELRQMEFQMARAHGELELAMLELKMLEKRLEALQP